MPDAVAIRHAMPPDTAAIARVVTAAFGQPGEAALVRALRAAGDSAIELVAAQDGAIAGHVLLSPMTAPFRALGLAPVSVVPERQGRGIGDALIRAALERARAADWQAVFVLGDPGYYARFGFSAEAAAGFRSPYGGDHFMLLALSPLPTASGAVDYAPAFGAL